MRGDDQTSAGARWHNGPMTSRQFGGPSRASWPTLWPALLLPLLAFTFVVPLIAHGPSCGHDYGFHVQSWMDASEQLRHGTLLARWAFSPAYNAGEPRFVFYPPISWLLGSLLLLLLPSVVVTTVYTWIALTGAALGMYALAVRYTSRAGALLAATVYIGNPYIFFTAFERTAFAELLAAAWMPLLFRAALAEAPSAPAIAVPLALLWLTNAPAAVMGTYALVLLAVTRCALAWRSRSQAAQASAGRHSLLPLLTQVGGGLLLGLSLPAFYLLPAAWERRDVQIAMAIIPNMRVEDNFLFGGTGYGPHDRVLHTASLVALETAGLAAAVLLMAWVSQQRSASAKISGEQPADMPVAEQGRKDLLLTCVLVVAVIFLLLWHFTLPLWHTLPELAFLQFPWRLLAVLGPILGLGVALASARHRLKAVTGFLLALALLGSATNLAYPPLREVCEAGELPADRLALFRGGHGVGPTDEYTPTTADNDQLRWHDPGFWLAADANAPAPGTVPNPAATIPDYDAMPPLDQTISGRAPLQLHLQLPAPEDLILNLRDYPAWLVMVNGVPNPKRLGRDDGLLAMALPAGASTVDIRWRTLPDVWAGEALSLLALAAAVWLRLRSRRIDSSR